MPLPLQIAIRFLFRSTNSRPLTLFTLISILGICFSVMLFLLIDTLVTGLSSNLRNTLLGFEAPLFLQADSDQIEETGLKIDAFSKQHPDLELRSIYTRQFDGLVEVYSAPPTGVRTRSVGKDFFEVKKGEIEIYWFEGYDEENFVQSDDLVLIGETLYERLPFLPGEDDTVLLNHPYADIGPGGEIEPVVKEMTVAGIFATGRVDYDDVYLLISDQAMTAIANDYMLKNMYFLFIRDSRLAAKVKDFWNREQKTPLMQTWFDRNKNIFKAMQLEKLMYFVIFMFVLMISCFNLAGVINIFGLSKSADTAVLRSMGLSGGGVRWIYVSLGLILGGLGMLLGMGFGLGLIFFLKTSHFSLPQAYGFTELPLVLNPLTLVFLIVGTPLIAALVSFFPTLRYNRVTVMDMLRLSA